MREKEKQAYEVMLSELETILAYSKNVAPLGEREKASIARVIELAKMAKGVQRERPTQYDSLLDNYCKVVKALAVAS
jgi:hypothetical protein